MEFSKLGPVYSALVGLTARRRLPVPLRNAAYRAFANAVGAKLDEAELDPRAYPSLGDFFARRLRPGVRTIDESFDAIIAPCDGVLAALGTAVDGALVQAKGKNYQLEDLVLDDALAAKLRGGQYSTICLSPKDYHRVHTPVDGTLIQYDYLPGAPRSERVVIRLNAGRLGTVAIVMVAETSVGNISLEQATFRAAGERRRIEVNREVQKGDELGAFRLGSTVIMVFEPGKVVLDGEVGQEMRFGERMGKRAGVGPRE